MGFRNKLATVFHIIGTLIDGVDVVDYKYCDESRAANERVDLQAHYIDRAANLILSFLNSVDTKPGFLTDRARYWLRENGYQDPWSSDTYRN